MAAGKSAPAAAQSSGIKFLSKDELPKRSVNREASDEQKAANAFIEELKPALSKIKGDQAGQVAVPIDVKMKTAQAARNKARRLLNTALEEHGLKDSVAVKIDAEPVEKDGEFVLSGYEAYFYAR